MKIDKNSWTYSTTNQTVVIIIYSRLTFFPTVCQRNLAHFYIGRPYMKIDKNSWTNSTPDQTVVIYEYLNVSYHGTYIKW